MKTSKIGTLFMVLLLFAAHLLVVAPVFASPSVYFSVQPVAIAPLTDINASINGLEAPASPSPVGQNFTVEIHLIGATGANLAGVEVHFDFSAILSYAQPVGYTDMLSQSGGVLSGSLLYAIQPGLYKADGTKVSSPPYANATQYGVAAASTAEGWNGTDGVVVIIKFKITGQPSQTLGQQDFVAPLTITYGDLSNSNAVEVSFSIVQGTLRIDSSGTQPSYSLTVNVVGGGSVTESPLNATYLSGTVVTLTAVPSPNWTFQGWSGDVSSVQNPVNITMNGNKTVTATFVVSQLVAYTLTVNVVGNGTITESPASATYLSGTVVTLTAVPGAGWTFQGWSGDVSGQQNPVNITMNGNKTVTATFSSQAFPGNIDLFTQKTPFSGKGPNRPSDAFQQQELLILYALVTFAGQPIANKVVGFQVNGPANSLQNITVIGAATTNASGIAVYSFRIPTAPINEEQIVFGEWHAVATVDVDQVPLMDSLAFEVGWIIAIKSIITLNDQLIPRTSFPRESTIVFNLTLENVAFIPESATIKIGALDIQRSPIIYLELDDLSIPPGESFIEAVSQIPENAGIGEANVSATAYTAPPTSGGVPWSPSVYAIFNIITSVYYTLTVNVVGNGSVTESPAAAIYLSGTVVTLTAVPSAGWTFQGWSGDVSGPQNPVDITMDTDKSVMAAFMQVAHYYTLTVNVVGGGSVTESPLNATYLSGTVVTLTAVPSAGWTFQGWSGDVSGQQNAVSITMNGNKEVTATFIQLPLQKHDVAIRVVDVSPSQVYVGESVQIVVEAANLGDYSETFNVTVKYDSSIIEVMPVVSLSPHNSETITVGWNTAGVSPGVYTVSANATVVEGDTNPENNNLIDGAVTIIQAPTYFVSYWVLLILFVGLAVLAGLVLMMLLLICYSRRRKRRRRAPRHLVLVHPHV